MTEARWIAKKKHYLYYYQIFIAQFLIIFFSQKWHFIERFINHTYSNLIPKYVLINAAKKKTILTASLGTEPMPRGHFNREQAKTKGIEHFYTSHAKSKSIFCNI